MDDSPGVIGRTSWAFVPRPLAGGPWGQLDPHADPPASSEPETANGRIGDR
jgi:hypothetical protein